MVKTWEPPKKYSSSKIGEQRIETSFNNNNNNNNNNNIVYKSRGL